MNNVMLKGLSFAGLCLLAMATGSQSLADGMYSAYPYQSCPTCPQPCPQPCPSCPGYCRTGCRHDCCLEPIKKWAFCCDYYILPPDYGWNAPVKVPVVRRGVTYYRYWPEQWYGTGSPAAGEYRSYPQVYAPNDTTQLGYTYQQVPYWQPAPHRLPQPPVPSQFHVREPHPGYYGRWQSSYTPIHHHHPAHSQYWVEPICHQRYMPSTYTMQHAMPYSVPTYPAGPVGCPPAPEPNPAPRMLVPVPEAPAPAEPMAPAPAAPPADAKAAGKAKTRLTTMMPKWRRPGE
ncbi:MAG: hypothetical protein ACKV2Q_34370 [Planctomycetaceae bacterium]